MQLDGTHNANATAERQDAHDERAYEDQVLDLLDVRLGRAHVGALQAVLEGEEVPGVNAEPSHEDPDHEHSPVELASRSLHSCSVSDRL